MIRIRLSSLRLLQTAVAHLVRASRPPSLRLVLLGEPRRLPGLEVNSRTVQEPDEPGGLRLRLGRLEELLDEPHLGVLLLHDLLGLGLRLVNHGRELLDSGAVRLREVGVLRWLA